MGAPRYILGLALVVATAVPLLAGAVRVRARFLPDSPPALARLAELVIVLASYLIVGELLGVVGLFRTGFVVTGCVVLAALLVVAGGGRSRRRGATPTPGAPVDRGAALLAAVVAGTVFAQWCSGVIGSLRTGMVGDTIVYHGPFAARFAQDGWVTRLHFITVGQVIPFHPANSELLHATGILFLGNDFLSPLANLAWLAMALLAAWCIGIPRSVAPATMAAVALPLSGRFIAVSQAGTDVNDIVAIAFFLAAVAFLVARDQRPASLVLAGLAAGLCVGTKFTAVIPAAAVTAAMLAVRTDITRLRRLALWGAPLVAGGCFWYARNLARAGNPLPAQHIGLGPISLPSPRLPVTDAFGATVAGNLGKLRSILGPALDLSFGRLWLVVLLLAAAGAALALATDRSPLRRLLAAAALVAAVGYLFTPTTGNYYFFAVNLRYLLPALVLGLALLPSVPALSSPWRQRALVAAFVVVVVVNVAPATAWPAARGTAVAVAAVVAAAPAAWLVMRRLRLLSIAIVIAALLTTVVIVGGRHVEQRYLANRYAHDRSELGQAFKWARGVRGERIAVAGTAEQYPFYGVTLSNHVDYMGVKGPHGEFSEFRGCRAWRLALARGRYRYVVAFPGVKSDPQQPPEAQWTRMEPSAREIVRAGRASVFRIDGPVGTSGCPD